MDNLGFYAHNIMECKIIINESSYVVLMITVKFLKVIL